MDEIASSNFDIAEVREAFERKYSSYPQDLEEPTITQLRSEPNTHDSAVSVGNNGSVTGLTSRHGMSYSKTSSRKGRAYAMRVMRKWGIVDEIFNRYAELIDEGFKEDAVQG